MASLYQVSNLSRQPVQIFTSDKTGSVSLKSLSPIGTKNSSQLTYTLMAQTVNLKDMGILSYKEVTKSVK